MSFKILLVFCLMGVFFGCSSKQLQVIAPDIDESNLPSQTMHDQDVIRNLILEEFKEWERTPHKMGGNNKRGIDCSGFAHYIYKKLFNIHVPRTTRRLFSTGIKINKSQLKPGDLVAFRPHSYPRHVGIYIGNNKFIHASTTKGVMMSDLSNPYWIKHYVMSRRIIKN